MEVVAEAREAVQAAYDANSSVPPDGGPSAKPGVKLFYLTAGLASDVGTKGAAAVEEAAAALDWEVRIFDGKFSPDTYQEGLRQAISWGADAVLLNAIDCPGNERPLQQVDQAGIPVVAISAVDCNEVDSAAEPLFDAMPAYPGAKTPREYFVKRGAAQADWIISQSEGKAKVIEFPVPDFLITAATQEGFEKRLEECGGCQLAAAVPIGVMDFGTEVQDKAQQALLKHPDADYFAVSYDDLMNFGIASAVKNSGRNDEIGVIAGVGHPANMELIRGNQGQDAGVAYLHEWDHFAGVDTVNRVLSGEGPAVVGPPVVLYDAKHNLPTEGGFVSGGDFRSVFISTWRG